MIDSDLTIQPEVSKAVELERFIQSISNIAAYNNINFTDYQALQFQVTELFKKPDQSRHLDSVLFLAKKYSWALRPISILFASVIGVE
jgi:hypothetical protein|tara:strand:+ start:547 stop:810 length:264 start_codon:yes stop_codon:yes gene_type:complete